MKKPEETLWILYKMWREKHRLYGILSPRVELAAKDQGLKIYVQLTGTRPLPLRYCSPAKLLLI